MITGPTVAIITPTYNRAAYLRLAIESVLQQSFEAWELHVVDDGSFDGTPALASLFSDSRIRWTRREHVGLAGLSDTYNQVVEGTTAPLIAILEDDDLWPPDKLERQVADFANPDVVLSYGRAGLIDECGCEYGTIDVRMPPSERLNRPVGAILSQLLYRNPIVAPTVVVRRAAVCALGGFWQPHQVPFVDHPTWLKLATVGEFAYHDSITGYWRRHRAQATTRAAENVTATPIELDYIADFLREAINTPDERDRLLADIAASLRRRDLLTRWRRVLLDGDTQTVFSEWRTLIGSGHALLMLAAIVGLVSRLAGSDLEWVQILRHRAAWPGRRHAHESGRKDCC